MRAQTHACTHRPTRNSAPIIPRPAGTRGVRGVLPKTFWVPDEQGIVCAVDMAFMSTSRNKNTPIGYMVGEGADGMPNNVLWALRPKPETLTRPKAASVIVRRRRPLRVLPSQSFKAPHMRVQFGIGCVFRPERRGKSGGVLCSCTPCLLLLLCPLSETPAMRCSSLCRRCCLSDSSALLLSQ